MYVMREDVVEEVRRHVPGAGLVGPFAWGVVSREAVAPVFSYGDEVTVEDPELGRC